VLGAGVQGLSAHDQPGANRPLREIDQLGEFGHGCSRAQPSVLMECRLPELFESNEVEDCGVDLGI
jgi:hypothetical protein